MNRLTLGIDFGTTNTAAAFLDERGELHDVRLSSSSALMPSAVFAEPDGIVGGTVAQNLAMTDPTCFEPNPKRRIGEQSVRLGDRDHDPVALVAAVLDSVITAAMRVSGRRFDRIVLTHPDSWAGFLQSRLRDAAARVTDAQIHLITEARAAAAYYSRTPGVKPDLRICVFDFGAGTCDVAVLDRDPDGSYRVVAAQGDPDIGGRDLDARLFEWVVKQVMGTTQLRELEFLDSPRHRLNLLDRVREAKETLSTSSKAVIALPVGERPLQLTRPDFNRIIDREIGQAVDLTRRVIGQAQQINGTRTAAKIYLVGGSSHIPLVHERLAELGTVATLGDPKTVVVHGALLAETAPEPRRERRDPTPPPQPRPQAHRVVFPRTVPGGHRLLPPVRLVVGVGQEVASGGVVATCASDDGRTVSLRSPVAGRVLAGPTVAAPAPDAPVAVVGSPGVPPASFAALPQLPATVQVGPPTRSDVMRRDQVRPESGPYVPPVPPGPVPPGPVPPGPVDPRPAAGSHLTRNLVIAGVAVLVIVAVAAVVGVLVFGKKDSKTGGADTTAAAVDCSKLSDKECVLAKRAPASIASTCVSASKDYDTVAAAIQCHPDSYTSAPYYGVNMYDLDGSTTSVSDMESTFESGSAGFPNPTSAKSWSEGRMISEPDTDGLARICSTNRSKKTTTCMYYNPSVKSATDAYNWGSDQPGLW